MNAERRKALVDYVRARHARGLRHRGLFDLLLGGISPRRIALPGAIFAHPVVRRGLHVRGPDDQLLRRWLGGKLCLGHDDSFRQ